MGIFIKSFDNEFVACCSGGQGTLEYLVIVGVVIVISLVVVGIVLSQSNQASSISVNSNSVFSKAGAISIYEAVIGLDGNGLIKIQNNTGENIVVKKFSIEGIETSDYSILLGISQTALFDLNGKGTGCGCTNITTKNCKITIYYTTSEGLLKHTSITIPVNCTQTANPVNKEQVKYTDNNQNNDNETDTTPPILSLPEDIIVETTSQDGKIVNFSVSATDNKDGQTQVLCNHQTGELFPLGTTTIDCNSTDSANNTSYGNFTIQVNYINPTPTLSFMPPTPNQGTTVSGDFNIAMSFSEQIEENLSMFINLDDSLVGWWRGENNANDSSGNINNGTWSGEENYETGVFGYAFKFNGNNSFITIPKSDYFYNNNFTISYWLNGHSVGTGNTWCGVSTTIYWAQPYSWFLSVHRGVPSATFNIFNEYYEEGYVTGITEVRDSGWHMVTATVDDSSIKIYIDGILENEYPFGVNMNPSEINNPIFIGYQFDWDHWLDNYFSGLIDEVMLFKRALSSEEVKALYNAQTIAFNSKYSLGTGEHSFKGFVVRQDGSVVQTELRSIQTN